ncbi:MAG: OmpH family outer membrane protein [Rhodospirillales bacterium]|nr:OmpH family outer membrane protein [Rhodospirillales bacterium]
MSHNKFFTVAITGMIVLGATYSLPALAQNAAKDPAPQAQAAQAMPPLNIRIVNIDAIRGQSKAFAAAREKITTYAETSNQALQKEDTALRDANAELNRKRTLLAPEAFAEERKKFEQRVADFQRKTQEQQKAINKLQLDAMGPINEKIVQIISQYAEANNVTLILPSQSVLLRADAYAIDAYVLERLNKELPSVTVSLPKK